MYEGENDGEMELAEVAYYFPAGKWTSRSISDDFLG